jgi:hypothetical protein
MITEVFSDPPIGSPGSPADQWSADQANIVSATLEADTAPGLFVTRGSADKTATVIDDDDDVIIGLVCKSEHLATPSQIDADGVIQSGVTVGLAKTGRRVVYVNGAFTPASAVYIRHVADTEGPVGSIQATSDAGKNRLVPAGAITFVTSGEDELGVVELNLALDANAGAADS